MSGVQISLAEVSELQGKGIDVLTSHVVDEHNAKSASNDPADVEAKAKAKAETTEAKAEPKGDAKAEPAKADPAKPKDDGVQKRISEITKARRTAERTAAAERAAREAAEAEVARLREQAAKDAPKPVRPKREDFEDQEAYVDALVDFKLAEKQAKEATERDGKDADAETKRKGEEAERKAQEAAEAIAERFSAQQDEARKRHDDYDEVITRDVKVMPNVVLAVLHSDLGGELLYHLGEHPEVAAKLNELDQASMLKELGKIELSLTPKEEKGGDGAVDQPRGPDGTFKPKGREISSAAEPIKPVTGSDEGAGPKDPERMSVAEHRVAAARASGRLR